ncbi:molecular chaperone HtpG [Tichowtungia aerotolerans]|uniref:Chaperone protein HtpG n=1 Tax=Tichowtungia aerotolerans TaxID=2697043 RepID=A0A6P1MBR6_9BACT|nr:molecular chaperone HtpG [Tichowtungia aerotolerans]QHI70543.1 molecular chaperone HtpG [Tichowtungia aerotolerans]
MAEKTMEFKTELSQLLHLITHSLYSHREIFLRELISNACDAIDKIRFAALTETDLLDGDSDWKIRLSEDKEAKTLTISDNGVGMDEEALVENLGTIAHSGTKAFLARLQEEGVKDNPDLIGQFGVGFYSSFMVADRVVVDTRMHGKDAVKWESEGTGSFTLGEGERETRGTSVTLYLKEDAAEYLEEYRLRSLVKKFSDFIEHPVVMKVTRTKTEGEGDDKKEIEVTEDEILNTQKAIWLRAKTEISNEDYNEFYKHISHDFNDPAEVIHYSAEGAMEFKALLFVPEKRPFDMLMGGGDQKAHIHLYIQRVFISSDFENLLPPYLRFVKGVVDAADLPLNVSREILQENPQLDRIRKNLVSRILKTLATMKDKEFDKYLTFYSEFGPILKEGLQSDFENREKIADLLLFETTKTEAGKLRPLSAVVEAMDEKQEEIIYLSAEHRGLAENSPFLEGFKADDKEVVFFLDPIDEFVMPQLHEYKGKKFKAANKGDAGDDKELKEEKKKFEGFLGFVKDKLSGVKEVRLSTRLKESPACLVGDEYSMSPHIEAMMRRMGQPVPETERVLELNPTHPAVQAVQAMYEADKDDAKLGESVELLRDLAHVAEGSKVDNPAAFASRIADLMARDLKG